MSEPKLDATGTPIKAMEHMDGITHAMAIVAHEDGYVECRAGNLPCWMIKGLLKEAIAGYDHIEVADIEDDDD